MGHTRSEPKAVVDEGIAGCLVEMNWLKKSTVYCRFYRKTGPMNDFIKNQNMFVDAMD